MPAERTTCPRRRDGVRGTNLSSDSALEDLDVKTKTFRMQGVATSNATIMPVRHSSATSVEQELVQAKDIVVVYSHERQDSKNPVCNPSKIYLTFCAHSILSSCLCLRAWTLESSSASISRPGSQHLVCTSCSGEQQQRHFEPCGVGAQGA